MVFNCGPESARNRALSEARLRAAEKYVVMSECVAEDPVLSEPVSLLFPEKQGSKMAQPPP